jgi:2-polyprenyl-6-methoxyphenol hydroxylase-like FAD-dependent oxidoreductase
MLPSNTEVLVVGAGPVGLAAAAALRYRGVDVTVIDRQAAGSHTSRAAVVHPRTLEVLDEIGASEPLAGRSLQLETFTIRDRDRVLMPLRFDRMPSRYRTIYMVPQSTTEEVIAERLAALGGRVLRPHVLTDLVQDAAGVTATVDGAHQIRADYLIGADGIRSTVREAAGIGFGPDRGGQSFTLADVTVDRGLPADEVGLFFSPAGMLVCAPLPGGVFRLVAEVLQAPEHPDVATSNACWTNGVRPGRRQP